MSFFHAASSAANACASARPMSFIRPAWRAALKACGPRPLISASAPAAASLIVLPAAICVRRRPSGPLVWMNDWAETASPIWGRSKSEPLSWTGAAVCRGPWTGPALSARKIARSAPRPSAPVKLFNTINTGDELIVARADAMYIEFQTTAPGADKFATGDYYCVVPTAADHRPRRIVSSWERGLKIADRTSL